MGRETRWPTALTIAGSDSSGGAGIQADLKTFAAFGVYGASCITALTAQNTTGVQAVSVVDPAFVVSQLDSVLADLNVVAVKTGMLANASIVAAVAARLKRETSLLLVVDPVMIATSGDQLLTDDAVSTYLDRLLPLATLVTPNLPEAARLLGVAEARTVDESIDQAKALVARGCRAVLLKGGHASGTEIVDILCTGGGSGSGVDLFRHPRVVTHNTHGTGCTLSAAITAALVERMPLNAAVAKGIDFVGRAVLSGALMQIGRGHGPVDHQFALRPSNAAGP